jgi:hypothetical protein
LPDDLLEELQPKLRDFFEQSDPFEPDTWYPEILSLTERLILDGRAQTIRRMKRSAGRCSS